MKRERGEICSDSVPKESVHDEPTGGEGRVVGVFTSAAVTPLITSIWRAAVRLFVATLICFFRADAVVVVLVEGKHIQIEGKLHV